jgi:tripartite-type tricarboxylate transporter receptor subunit TctC
VAEKKRSWMMPNHPTIDESGLTGFEVGNWAGLLGPAGLDPAIVTKLNREIIAILATADMQERIRTLGYDVIASTPEEFGTQMKNDVARWSDVVRRANIPMN